MEEAVKADGSALHFRRPLFGATVGRKRRATDGFNGITECLCAFARFTSKAKEIEVIVEVREFNLDEVAAMDLRTKGIHPADGTRHERIKH
jgi:hypothetical protein